MYLKTSIKFAKNLHEMCKNTSYDVPKQTLLNVENLHEVCNLRRGPGELLQSVDGDVNHVFLIVWEFVFR